MKMSINQGKNRMHDREAFQEQEYVIPYHYLDLFAPGQEIERISIFDSALEEIGAQKGMRILDVGCGDGRFCYHAKTVCQMEGIDISERALGWARMYNPELVFRKGMLQAESLEKFDGAVCLEVIEHIPDEELASFIQSIHDCLKPGAKAFFSVPSTQVQLTRKHYRHYDENSLRRELVIFLDIAISGHSRVHSMIMPLFSLLNLVSMMFFSTTFLRHFSGLAKIIIKLKRLIWKKYLHSDIPIRSKRLFAVCTRNEFGRH